MDENALLNLALDVGEIMLTSGAETHRVGDRMERILSYNKKNSSEVFVTRTGLFVSINPDEKGSYSKLKRIQNRSVNLEKVSLANSISRDFVDGKITIDEAFEKINEIQVLPQKPWSTLLVCYTIVSCAFTFMFNGSIYDSICSLIVGFFTGVMILVLGKYNVSTFLSSFFGGGIIAALALFFYGIGFGNEYSKIIIGCLMPLVPGVAITNAIRDIMAGDYLSGTSRMVEAFLVAVAVAGGVGIVLNTVKWILGGI